MNYANRQEYQAGQGLIGQQPSMPVSERQPQIAVQMEILEKEIAANRDVVERLGNKLGPVMSLEGPTGENAAKLNEPTCPIANALQRMTHAIADNTAILSSIIRRIEV